MKVSQQGYLLIAVPVVCQIVTMLILFASQARLEQALSAEAKTKRIITVCDELNTAVSRAVTDVTKLRMARALGISQASVRDIKASTRESLKSLTELTRNDPRLTPVVAEYRSSLDRMLRLLDELVVAINGSNQTMGFSEFLTEDEYSVELFATSTKLIGCAAKVRDVCAPTVRELEPLAIQARQQFFIILVTLVTLNVIISTLLAYFFGKNFVTRLRALMLNVEEFASGKIPSTAISGNDELQELDERFRVAVEDRKTAEESRNAMMQIVAHDLRTPITSLSFAVTSVAEGLYGEMNPKLNNFFSLASAEMERLVNMTSNILDFDKAERGAIELQVEPEYIETLLTRAASSMQGLASNKDIKFTVTCDDDLMVDCDGERITQVLVNLLGNAVKFAPKQSEIRLVGIRTAHGARLEVTDAGPGIPKDAVAHLFERFGQVKDGRKGEGSGLGLWICKTIIEKHNGKIGVSSEANQGSTFWIELPNATTDTK